MQLLALDELIGPDHRVRYVWQYVESLDLSPLYDKIKAAGERPGRSAIDPQILFALWLFATIEGISSARYLETLTTRDFAFLWICGGVSVNYHTLADFRAENGDLLDALMVKSIAVLLKEELITLDTIAQDGMRVRANAGADSFRRRPTLEEALEQAKSHCEEVKKQHEENSESDEARSRAAKERAANERVTRIEAAIAQLDEIDRRKKARSEETENNRASTTDPEARKMKMGDNGFRAALNVQFATDGDTRLIVGTSVTSSGSDAHQMGPMHQTLKDNYDVTPRKYLVDGPFVTKGDLDQLDAAGTSVLGPIPGHTQDIKKDQDPYAPKPGDSEAMAKHRQRMSTEEAKEHYKRRPGIAEFPNAGCRNRGFHQFSVRGLVKAKAETLWHVHAHNFLRFVNLGFLAVLSQT
jgi:transposase